MTPPEATARLRDRFGLEAAAEGGALQVTVEAARWRQVAAAVRDDLGCRYFSWLSAVDWKAEGLEVVARVENLDSGPALTLRTRVPADAPRCPSLVAVWPGADWMERECYDLLGVVFEDHPDLRRILLPDDWEGHPLRKDWAFDTPHLPYR